MADLETLRAAVMPEQVVKGLVWHYTSAKGIDGILRSSSLWASSVHALNDDQELFHGLDLIRVAAGKASERVGHWVDAAAHRFDESVLGDSFVVSASLDGQSSHQFVHYGKYALGFSSASKDLAKRPESPSGPAELAWEDPRFASGWRKVIYGIPEGLAHARKVVDVLRGLIDGSDDDATDLIIRAAAYLKSDSWKPEREVRLYGRADPSGAPVKVRVRGDELVRLIDITTTGDGPVGVSKLPLEEIRLAPELSASPGAVAGVKALLMECGYEGVKVRNGLGKRTR